MKGFDRFLIEYLTSKSIAEACERAGISQSTGYRYLNDPRFKTEHTKLRHQFIDESMHRLQCLSDRAVTELDGILKNENSVAQAKLGAAKLVLEMCCKTLEIEKLEERLSRIEANWKTNYEKNGSG